MRRIALRAVLGLFAGYVVAWLAAFVLLVGSPSLIGSYLTWSWTGGGELVAFVQLAGLLGAAVGVVAGSLAGVLARPKSG